MNKVLVVGFEKEILAAIRKRFNVKYVINCEAGADIDWWALHDLRIEVKPPVLTAELLACFEFLKSHYLQFVDINSRRHNYVPAREAETYNGFILTVYKAYEVLKENEIDLLIHANLPHEGFDFIFHHIANFLNIPSILCHQAIIPNHFWLSTSITDFGRFSVLPVTNEYDPINYHVPKEWFYMGTKVRDESYSIFQLFSEVLLKPHRIVPGLIRWLYARQYRDAIARLTNNKPDFLKKYIYFPMHMQPELTTSALGGIYSDQLLALECLSAKLPDDVLIYVKENPKQTEKQRGPLFYKRLGVLKNVVLLPNTISSLMLIDHSIAVATITGTAGWEALFRGKPVLIFGIAWYREFPGVTYFDRYFEYAAFINKVPPNPNLLIEKLNKFLQKAGKGITDLEYARIEKHFSSEKNAILVAESLKRFALASDFLSVELKNDTKVSC